MNYTVPLPSLSIDHPLFDRVPICVRKPLHESGISLADVFEGLRPSGLALEKEARLPGGRACLLPHISPHLKKPPHPDLKKPDTDRFYFPAHSGEIVDTLTGVVYPSNAIPDDSLFWLHVYKEDVIVKRPWLQGVSTTPEKTRGKIFQFSDASRSRLLFTARNSGHYIVSQFLCTFHSFWPLDGKELKKILDRFLKRLRRRFPSLHYLWILEFQKRGAPHFHVFTDIPVTRENHVIIAQAWLQVSGQSEDDMSRRFHMHKENFFDWDLSSGAYLVKQYIGKVEQKDVPSNYHDVGRFWGASSNMKPDFTSVDPCSYPENEKEMVVETIRIITRLHDKQVDQYKSLRLEYEAILRRIGAAEEELSTTIKRQIMSGIRANGHHKIRRLCPHTNKRKRPSYKLPGMTKHYFDVINWMLDSKSSAGSFLSFSRYVDGKEGVPARRTCAPF